MLSRLGLAAVVVACQASPQQPGDARGADPSDAPDASCPIAPVEIAQQPDNKAGSRLHPIYWTSPDGLDVLGGFYNSTLGVECQLNPSPLGNPLTCSPIRYPDDVPPYGNVLGGALDTPNCSSKVYLAGPGLANSLVGEQGLLFQLGEEILPKPSVYCVAFTLTPEVSNGRVPGPSYHVYRIRSRTDSEDPAFSVSFSGSSTRPLTAVNDAVFWHGGDGSVLFTGMLADRVHKRCGHFQVRPDPDLGRWLPPSPGYGGCEYALGEGDVGTLGSSVYRFRSVICEIQGPGGPPVKVGGAVPVQPPIPLSEFDEAPLVEVGGSRLVLRVRADGGFPIVSPDTRQRMLHDRQLDIDCTPQTASDGTLRCLPPEPRIGPSAGSVMYADPACTQPLIASISIPPPAMVREARVWATCSPLVYAPGEEIAVPSAFYVRVNCGACERGSSENLPQHVFAAGELPPAMFAAMAKDIR